MSGSIYAVSCSRCGEEHEFEIYDDWFAVQPTIDCNTAVCQGCHEKECPEQYNDYQCARCGEWRCGEPYPGTLCYKCAIKVLEATAGRVTPGDTR